MQPRRPIRRASIAAALALALQGLLAPAASAQRVPSATAPNAPPNSELDAPLFYQVLIGEMRLASGEAGTAYEVIMDAARRTRDEQLFRRAAEIALQSRQADQALATARSWRSARPQSSEPLRLEVQVLLALDRQQDAIEPVRSLIRLAPASERAGLVAALPRTLARRGVFSAGSAEWLDTVLAPFAGEKDLAATIRVASGQAWLAAGNIERAHAIAAAAHRADPADAGAAQLALELMPKRPDAEAWVVAHLATPKAEPATRLAYVRALMGAQRHADALRQIQLVTSAQPTQAAPFLSQGALELELRQFSAADASLQRFLALLADEKTAAAAAKTASKESAGAGATADDDDDQDAGVAHAAAQRDDAAIDAYLLLARSAEQRGDHAASEAWLARIDDPRRLIEVQTRRATSLARQGQVDEARQVIRRSPERTAEDARGKLLAEAAVLREVKRWSDAWGVLNEAAERFSDDADILYEQSMLAEKLQRMDEAERLLRRVIELKPDHAHAYNALGYALADRGQRLPEARQLIAKALELTPGDPFITDSLGWVEFRLGNHAEALRLLRQAWTARPDAEIGAHLGEVLWTLGRRDEARAAWREAQLLDPSNEALRETLARLKVKL